VSTSGGISNITGTNFGPEAADIIVLINGEQCTDVIVENDSKISCIVAPGTGADLLVNVTVGDQYSTSTFSYLGKLFPIMHVMYSHKTISTRNLIYH
jgi:IPT/TIG domain